MLTLRDPALQAIRLAKMRAAVEFHNSRGLLRYDRYRFLNTNNPLWYDAAVNAVTALLNSGTIRIYTGTQPALNAALTGTLLATMTFGATAFGASSGGTATANAITSGTAAASGTAGYFAVLKSDGTTVVATGTVATSGADLNVNTTAFTSGVSVSCSSFTITG